MEHEVVPEPGREVQLREMISHLLTVLDPLAAWYLLTMSSFISTDLRAQGQAVDGPDDEVSSSGTTRSSISLRKIIPTDIRDLGCSGVAWPEQRPPALRSSSSAAPAAFANKNTFFMRQGRFARRPPGAPSHAPLLWPPPGTCFCASGRRPPRPRHPRVPTARHPEPPSWPNQRRIQPSTPQGDSTTASGALPAPNRSC